MKYPSPKIKFYRVRTFSEKLNVTFDFLRETWKPFLKFSFYLIMPVCLVQAFVTNLYMRAVFSSIDVESSGAMVSAPSVMINYGVLMLCVFTGSLLLSAMVYALMREYERRESRLLEITFAGFKDVLMENIGKMVTVAVSVILAVVVLMLMVGFLVWVSPWTLLLTVPLLLVGWVVVAIPLALFVPVYLFEDLPFFKALRKAFRLGFAAWGETFLVVLLFGLLSGMINMVTMMPWYVVTLVGELLSIGSPGDGITSSVWYQFGTYVLGIVQSYGTYVGSIVSATGIAFQYFHLREKKEGVAMRASIMNFDRL
jgi:hypothetical protein